MRNNGSGGLTRGADIPLVDYTAGPRDILLADLNGDGALDLLAAIRTGRASDGVCIRMNNGAGSFSPPVRYPAGQSTTALAVADINGDGKPDVLSTDDYSNAVAVRYNPGNGVFPTIPEDFAGSAPNHQDAADLDGDGDLDLFTSGSLTSADSGAIMRNNGSGRFSGRTVVNNGLDGVAAGVLRDLNGDGKPDLLFNNSNTASRSDFFTALNNGQGSFGPITRWIVGSAGWGTLDAFDIDNDGDLDVIDCEALGAPEIPPGRFFISLNNGNGTFQAPYAYSQLPARPSAVVGRDFNHDGKIDLAFANQGSYGFDSGVFVVLGNGNGTFQSPLVYTAGRGPLHIVSADFDGDGNLDLATLNSGYNNEGAESLSLLFGTGTGTFLRQSTHYAAFSPDLLGATGLAVGDIDRDGDLDLLAVGVSNDVAVYLNNGAGVFSFPYRIGSVKGARALLYRDFTGDGTPDLALLTSPPPLGFDGGAAVVRGLGPTALLAQTAVARKTHGAAGTFDIDLPLGGAPGIESRSGSDHTLLVTFSNTLSSGNASLTSGTGSVSSALVSGNTLTVNLTGVANLQTVTVSLNNVTDTFGQTLAPMEVRMTLLFGDANGNGIVNASDVSQVKANAGATVTAINFRSDVTANGSINGSDVAAVKSASGGGASSRSER